MWGKSRGTRRAVSPVIGVILMVAVTVILAAVIGVFVLEIGDQQETAPNASFDSDQSVNYYDGQHHPGEDDSGGPLDSIMRSDDYDANLTTVAATHVGGDALEISRTNLLIAGNGSAWKAEDRSGRDDRGVPQPNLLRTLGNNDPVTVGAGTRWTVIGSGDGEPDVRDNRVRGDENLEASHNYDIEFGTTTDGDERAELYYDSRAQPNGLLRLIETGDDIRVVWSAASGSKTQMLFKYTVQ